MIVLVGTPIGNLGDLSPRAVEALSSADVIVCEDTRRTRKLLSAAGVAAPKLLAMHQHNEASAAQQAVRLAAGGQTVAVVSDAGMPGISDPGQRVVLAAVDAGVGIEVVPGPSAALTALVASGLPAERFMFEGFLPRRGRDRSDRLATIGGREVTSVIYEAPHRALRTLQDLAESCGPGRRVAIARELTKMHEEFWRGTAEEAVKWASSHEPVGEWVIVVAPAPPPATATAGDIRAALKTLIEDGADRRGAVAAVSARLGVPKRDVYQAALDLGKPPG